MRDYHGYLSVVTPAAIKLLTTDEITSQTRVDIDDDNTLLDGYVAAAREHFEELSDKALLTQTLRLTLDRWPSDPWIALPRPPLVSVTSVTYTDADGNVATLSSSNYFVITTMTPGGILRKASVAWPSGSLRERAGIEITYVAGWSAAANVPQRYKQAVALLGAHWYEHRESVQTTGAIPQSMPMGWDSILLASRTY